MSESTLAPVNTRSGNRWAKLWMLSTSLALLSLACAASVPLDVARQFQTAGELFDNADYLKSAGVYQQIIDAGVTSGAVFYNQGNAFLKAGKLGQAIADYRLAQRYRPRDPFIEANLQYALTQAKTPAETTPLAERVLFWQNWLSYPEKFWLTGIAAGVVFVLATTALFAESAWAARLRRCVAIAVTVSAFFGASAAYDWHRYEGIRHGVVATKEAIARKGNGDNYAPAFTESIKEGTEFIVSDERGDWLLVQLPNGEGTTNGWIKKSEAVVY